MGDSGELERFVEAQDSGATYERAMRELGGGRKVSHWMWFIFPQIAGLGRSPTAQHFAIKSMKEAKAYLAHPVLGARLLESARLLTLLPGADPVAVLGSIDALKLHSSMTLFAQADPTSAVFSEVLAQYFDGKTDANTVQRI